MPSSNEKARLLDSLPNSPSSVNAPASAKTLFNSFKQKLRQNPLVPSPAIESMAGESQSGPSSRQIANSPDYRKGDNDSQGESIAQTE